MIEKFNCRQTKIRRGLLAALVKSKVPQSATDILSTLKKDNPTLNKSTVYRQLDFLVNHQILSVIEINNQNHYQLNQNHPHTIMICTNCKKFTPLQDSLPPAKVNHIAKANHFQLKNYSLVLIGKCHNCQK